MGPYPGPYPVLLHHKMSLSFPFKLPGMSVPLRLRCLHWKKMGMNPTLGFRSLTLVGCLRKGANKQKEECSVWIEKCASLTKTDPTWEPTAKAQQVPSEALLPRVQADNEEQKLEKAVNQTLRVLSHLEPPHHPPGGAWLCQVHERVLGMTGTSETVCGGAGCDWFIEGLPA
ncbi:hypothetical protein NDU88_000255 [Pleurodeles waltl]|uniref:Uncharacterized protein n=1 Tax=Pleurodeles waltl TaxID=8319 RepID=A0AAV7KN04_PLEWA|nr:hypothetical protein NDU88_000255 [Pleurodeles waltl]